MFAHFRDTVLSRGGSRWWNTNFAENAHIGACKTTRGAAGLATAAQAPSSAARREQARATCFRSGPSLFWTSACSKMPYWGPDAEQPSEAGAAAVVEDAPLRLALNGPADRAGRDVRQALLANPDLSYLPEAQSVYASPSFRGAPRYSRVAVVQGDGDDVWRGEVRLLFKAHPPTSTRLAWTAPSPPSTSTRGSGR